MIRKGTIVRLKAGTEAVDRKIPRLKDTARVVTIDKVRKGGVFLDKCIGGFRWWNVTDLERAA
jgi:hypothetical protein